MRLSFAITMIVLLLALSLPAQTPVRAEGNSVTNRTWAPWRSQYDGTYHELANCGPAALAMVMARYDEWWSTGSIRRNTNDYMNEWSRDAGTSWESLAYAAKLRGFLPYGLYTSSGDYHEWTMDELLAEVNAGHPVILLVRLKYLPGHSSSSRYIDHYIVFLGYDEQGNILYHDPAGAENMIISREHFKYVFGNTAFGVDYTGMSLRYVGN